LNDLFYPSIELTDRSNLHYSDLGRLTDWKVGRTLTFLNFHEYIAEQLLSKWSKRHDQIALHRSGQICGIGGNEFWRVHPGMSSHSIYQIGRKRSCAASEEVRRDSGVLEFQCGLERAA